MALSTAQQVGNAIGVAVTGVLFFGAIGHGYARAFEHRLAEMSGLLLAVAALTALLPVTLLASHLRVDRIGTSGEQLRSPVPPDRLSVGA
jgi:hypothetical protein